MKLNELRDNPGARKRRMRVGRGIGSGKGKTAARGVKGQKSRSGVAINGFEGGQMPLYRRLPKRGFSRSMFAKDFSVINVGRLQAAVDAGKLTVTDPIGRNDLINAGLARKRCDGIRLLGDGELTAKITIEVTGVSRSAREAVEKAGGTVVLIPLGPASGAESGKDGDAAA